MPSREASGASQLLKDLHGTVRFARWWRDLLSPDEVRTKVETIRREYAARDQRYSDIARVRAGHSHEVYPDLFPEVWPRPIVANFVDIAARDIAELIAPLPAFNCVSASMVSDKAKAFADKRTKIVHWYLQAAQVARQMYQAADWYGTYGMIAVIVEPNWKLQTPIMRFDDPYMAYPEFDRFGKVLSYSKVLIKPAHVLASEYPEFASKILTPDPMRGPMPNALLEVVTFMDHDQFTVFLPQRGTLVLQSMPNPLGRCPVRVAKRPTLDSEIRGQFDDAMWVQLAKARMAVLGMEAAEKSVQAPLAVPQDVQEFAFGPDAILRSQSPEKIRRVGIEMSPAALQQQEVLEQEVRVAARYPEARSGVPNASVITGRGIQELMGGFDTQIKAAQEILRELFREVVELCFDMDEKFWPTVKKTCRGALQGAPFEIDYVPVKDIDGDHTCDVTYGLAAGMDPNRWLVFMLQLRGDKLVPREFVQRNLPMDVNVAQLLQQIDIEESRDAIKEATFGLAQAVPQMVAQGLNPQQVMQPFVQLIQALQKGKSFENAAVEAFTPPAPPPDQQGQQQIPGQPPGMPGQPPGAPPGPPGQQGAPGGRPDLQMLLAGLTGGGKPNLQANVARRIPAA